MLFTWGILVYLTFTGCTAIIEAVTVEWGAGSGFDEATTMYTNGVLTADVPARSGTQTRTLPADARVMAWKFHIALLAAATWYKVEYSNGWSNKDSDCWKCTGIDVSLENWADIDYDDSAWIEPVLVFRLFSWLPGGIPLTIWCRHKLPVSDGAKFESSNNGVMPVSVAEKLKDENTGTCINVSEIYGAAMTTGIKVYPISALYSGSSCALNITGLGLECNRLRVYTEAAVTGSQCPKNGPLSRVAVTSQGSGSNGTVWCQFEYTAPTAGCVPCCVGCDKPVLLVFRASDAQVRICEIHKI